MITPLEVNCPAVDGGGARASAVVGWPGRPVVGRPWVSRRGGSWLRTGKKPVASELDAVDFVDQVEDQAPA